MKEDALEIDVPGSGRVAALWLRPGGATAAYVCAHGAGAGMTHPFLAAVAADLAARGVATLRYQFPYMQARKKRVDSPAVAQAAVRAAVAAAVARAEGLPIVAGGKSFGGRMTSQAEAASPLGVRGLAFLGFPLHPPDKPGVDRAEHLAAVRVPMLFLQGTKDELAELSLLRRTVASLGDRATLSLFEHADHSFHVLKSSGTSDAAVRAALVDALAAWIARVC
jgi:hypothetical protein